ncbi:MAG: hypothetical protein IJ260_08515 [Butyrivibrio sp.]|nr:hypothetical protein [Butyrivibrio sp.]MBQ8031551.1 hypothetical protein [Butyrivibrio sp.]MBR1642253.1 hypothetical protein [Butyrivibrio sp.]
MKLGASVGITVGIIVGLVIAFALLKVANTNHRMKTDYDERQQLIRGKGYMYAFYTILFYEVIMMIIDIGEFNLPIESYAVHCVGLILGVIVLGVYCIWNDVYWGLNNNKKSYYIIFAVCIIFNLIPIIGQARTGTLIQDGKIGLPILNIMVLIMMAVLGIEFIIKKLIGKNSPEEED